MDSHVHRSYARSGFTACDHECGEPDRIAEELIARDHAVKKNPTLPAKDPARRATNSGFR